MEWISDPNTSGAWLRERLDDDPGVVPHGYEAYARVLHPASVQWIPGGVMPAPQVLWDMPAAEAAGLTERMREAPATWADAAAAFGTTLHPLAQWQHLVRTPPEEDWNMRVAPDGRAFHAPADASMAPELLAVVAAHLLAHTTTPDAGCAALFEGIGGLVGYFGANPARGIFVHSEDPNHQRLLDRSAHDVFNNMFRKPVWQEGILSREISEGPRLELPDRAHVLFSAAPRTFADPAWILDAPWRDREAELRGFPPSAEHPSIIWPEDRAWVMVSEIDFDSTVIAGSAALVAEICADERLEVFVIPEDADLSWDGDTINR
ncbi:hypothetical protein ACWGJP_05760 [Microbacterium sp. NPDC055903]